MYVGSYTMQQHSCLLVVLRAYLHRKSWQWVLLHSLMPPQHTPSFPQSQIHIAKRVQRRRGGKDNTETGYKPKTHNDIRTYAHKTNHTGSISYCIHTDIRTYKSPPYVHTMKVTWADPLTSTMSRMPRAVAGTCMGLLA